MLVSISHVIQGLDSFYVNHARECALLDETTSSPWKLEARAQRPWGQLESPLFKDRDLFYFLSFVMFLLGKIHVLPDCPMAALELKYPPREIHFRNYFFFKNSFTSKFDIEELNREETLRVNSIKINFITFKEKERKNDLLRQPLT